MARPGGGYRMGLWCRFGPRRGDDPAGPGRVNVKKMPSVSGALRFLRSRLAGRYPVSCRGGDSGGNQLALGKLADFTPMIYPAPTNRKDCNDYLRTGYYRRYRRFNLATENDRFSALNRPKRLRRLAAGLDGHGGKSDRKNVGLSSMPLRRERIS